MNFKMISDIMLALDAGKRVGISKNVGTQFYAEYKNIDDKLYRNQGTEKILQGGFDCNNIIEYKIIEEKKEIDDTVFTQNEINDILIQIEKRLQNIECRIEQLEKVLERLEQPITNLLYEKK